MSYESPTGAPVRTRTRVLLIVLLVAAFCLLCTLGVLALRLILPRAPEPLYDAEALEAEVAAGVPARCGSVAAALRAWRFPGLDYYKFLYVEQTFCRNYYRPEDLRETDTLATKTARAFLADSFSKLDLTDKSAVTDTLLQTYMSVAGDPYCIYRSEKDSKVYEDDMSGQFGGVGIRVEYRKDEYFSVIEVMEETPAQTQGGIRAGDVLTHIGGTDVRTLGYAGSVRAIRGEIGTDVTMTFLRDTHSYTVTLTRALIEDKSVIWQMEDGSLAYVRISAFNENTDTQFFRAVDDALAAGARGFVFDVRANGGGYLSAVVRMLDYLLADGGVLVSFGDYSKPIYAGDSHAVNVPMVVLCDGNTASAAELFTAALRDYGAFGKATVSTVGTRTFGKGIMQQTYTFSDGSTLTLTVATYDPPCGVNYHGTGITPEHVEEYVAGETDVQKQKALRVLRTLCD